MDLAPVVAPGLRPYAFTERILYIWVYIGYVEYLGYLGLWLGISRVYGYMENVKYMANIGYMGI